MTIPTAHFWRFARTQPGFLLRLVVVVVTVFLAVFGARRSHGRVAVNGRRVSFRSPKAQERLSERGTSLASYSFICRSKKK